MEERSEYSVKKNGTRITPALSVTDALEILQMSVVNATKAGVEIKVTPLYGASKQSVVLVLENVELIDNNLVAVASNGKEAV